VIAGSTFKAKDLDAIANLPTLDEIPFPARAHPPRSP